MGPVDVRSTEARKLSRSASRLAQTLLTPLASLFDAERARRVASSRRCAANRDAASAQTVAGGSDGRKSEVGADQMRQGLKMLES